MKLYVVREGVVEPNPQLAIERILSSDVSRFFFFDGEMLRDYEELLDQDSSSMKILRDSIEHILGIPYLRIARNDLNEVSKKMEIEQARLLRRLGGEDYNQLANDYQNVRNDIDQKEGLVEELEKQIGSLEMEIAENKRKLADVELVKSLATERISIEKQLQIFEGNAKSERLKLKSLNSQLYKTVLLPMASNVIAQLQLKHNAVMAKYDKKQQLINHASALKQSKDALKCRLCGRILDEVKLKEVQAEFEETNALIESLTEIPEPNLEFDGYRGILNNILSKPLNREEYASTHASLDEINYETAKLSSRLDAIKQKLIDVDEEEPFRIETEIRKQSEELGRLKEEKRQTQEALTTDYEIKSVLQQKMDSINENELSILKDRIQSTKRIAEVFEKSISIYREERRKEVEIEATEIFKKIRSKEEFIKLSINENFGLSIITKDGAILDRAEWRSAGEEQIVALALIGALNKCVKIVAPIFMDTPFGRLDKKHGQRVLTYLPSMAEQVVALVTDREFGKDEESLLDGRIKSDFTIEYRGEREGTRIVKTRGEAISQ